MTPDAAHLYELSRALRTSFNLLKGLAEEMHRDLGINASMRAVMEAIAVGGERPVPEIAREKGVSRQHIQVNVDALLGAGLAELWENPAHKRSPLVALTRKGRKTFKKVRRREAKTLERLAAQLPPDAIETAAELLGDLNDLLMQRRSKGNGDG